MKGRAGGAAIDSISQQLVCIPFLSRAGWKRELRVTARTMREKMLQSQIETADPWEIQARVNSPRSDSHSLVVTPRVANPDTELAPLAARPVVVTSYGVTRHNAVDSINDTSVKSRD